MSVAGKREFTRIQKERRAEILDAALSAFSEAGYRGASINDIAERAGMSTPRLLYHFSGKEALYTELINQTLELWMEPLSKIVDTDEPIDMICQYIKRKLVMSQTHHRESRLFASAVLVGVKNTDLRVFEPEKTLFDEKIALINSWIERGLIAPVDPHHLIYSIWATTQHYSDFEEQISSLSPQKMPSLFQDCLLYTSDAADD